MQTENDTSSMKLIKCTNYNFVRSIRRQVTGSIQIN
jgi:hypothetical protein